MAKERPQSQKNDSSQLVRSEGMKTIAIIVLSSVGLYGQWITGHYAPGGGPAGEPASAIPWSKYTHIVHQQAWANPDGTVGDYGMSETPQMAAGKPAGKKLLIALGDNAANSGFVNATSPGTISTFINNLGNYMRTNGYDGVELDWEANVNTNQYIDLISRLRAAMPTAVINMDVANYNNIPYIAATSQSNLDQIQVMCYDEDSAGDGVT